MLQPTRRKYRKEQKGRNKGVATVGHKVSFGEYGLKAVGRGRLTARQIEAARRAMTRHEAADPHDVRAADRRLTRAYTMKNSEAKKALAAKTPVELKTELDALLKEQFGLRMQKATQQLTNTAKLQQVRRSIARARTLIHQKSKALGAMG